MLGMRGEAGRLVSLLGCRPGNAGWCVNVCVCLYLCVSARKKEEFPFERGIAMSVFQTLFRTL